MKISKTLIALTVTAVFTVQANTASIDDELDAIIAAEGLTGDPAKAFDLPSPYEPEVELGKLLFFSKALGGGKTAACASCHHPYLGGGDGLSLPVGADAQNPDLLGNGRKNHSGIFNNPRNTPTVFNAWLWQKGLFWDSRVEALPQGGIRTPDSPFGQADANAGNSLLEAQAAFPVTSVEEMRTANFEPGQSNDTVRAHLAARLGDTGIGTGELDKNHWRVLFEWVYGQPDNNEDVVNFDNIKRALASYEMSINLTDNPWFRYIKGDKNALNTAEKRGAKLFYTPPPEGGAGCGGCHKGDVFTNEDAFPVGFAQIGPGKGHGATAAEDLGRGGESQLPFEMGAFRVPTLLNVGVTAPYGHAGTYQTLEQVVAHYNDFDTALPQFVEQQAWCELPQFSEQQSCLSLFPHAKEIANTIAANIQALRDQGGPAMLPLHLNAEQKADLVAFLHSLTDPCTQSADCLRKWLPDPLLGDPDNLQLRATNQRGLPLAITRDCRKDTHFGGPLSMDQMECISGTMRYFYVYVPQNNSTLAISTTGGSGNADIFYNSYMWATQSNAHASATTANNEEVLRVKANRGFRFISVGSNDSYSRTGLTVSIERSIN